MASVALIAVAVTSMTGLIFLGVRRLAYVVVLLTSLPLLIRLRRTEIRLEIERREKELRELRAETSHAEVSTGKKEREAIPAAPIGSAP
jgi:hypothetical protein